ncbi:protein NRT1/ PTR FAMILY 5.10 [Hevea brasiliensis]|uniref:protein NRT1/ PTR FAMILY 5.10 n=1 Tax=Hevea brasiliensis TaxID=3981 RepID=UPI0025CC78CB|nr:protein NRT1/ PTR FAMILY 5.10 [Hevea brasiliensis]
MNSVSQVERLLYLRLAIPFTVLCCAEHQCKRPVTAFLPSVSNPCELWDTVDYKGLPAHKSTSGGWRSASFIIGVEVAERFAHFGISSNLITYLTGPLGQSTATAAENVNAWSGTASLLPLLGAFVADSFLGRYRTIVVASLIYLLGLGLMTISAMFPSHSASGCPSSSTITSCSPHLFEVVLFFFALYLAALGQGGHKPCVQAFGADQFDGKDPEECKAKSSFFNWWYFCMNFGILVTVLTLNYIQDNLGWALGFGIPCITMVIALLIFLLGTTTYRYSVKAEENSAVLRIGRVFLATIRNWRTYPSAITLEEEARGMLPHHGSEQFRFLNKTLLAPNGLKGDEKVCSLSEVEEAKAVLKLIPIWATCLVYAVVFAQSTTFFTKQGLTMDRSISKGLDIPPATLQCFSSFAVILFIPIYDRVFVPIARALTGKPSGITMLQRIGTGMFLSALTTAIAALVEMKRLEVAREHGLVDLPDVTLPMSARWLIPQYALFGVADVFTMIGLQEFFYDQVPRELRSVGLSLYLSIFGVGSFLSSFLISAIEKITSGQGHDSWFANNLNRGHLDYFYWLLAGLSMVQFVAYLYLAKNYIYNR